MSCRGVTGGRALDSAAKAFPQLVDEGVLYKRRGVGMFVSADARDRLRAQHRTRFFEAVVDPMITEAEAIGVDLADVVAHVRAHGSPADPSGVHRPDPHDEVTGWRNVSGKTSLLSALAAFRRPTAGQVTVNGQPVFENPDVVGDICRIRGGVTRSTTNWPEDRVEHALRFAATVRWH